MSKKSQQTSPINNERIHGLSNSLSALPKSSFSRCIVFYCLLAMALIIIAGFVFTYLGHDVDSIVATSLAACTGELVILGAKRILARSENIENVLLEEIHKELNDGIEYPVSTETTTITQTNSSGDKSTTTITKETSQPNQQDNQIKDDVSFYNTSFNSEEAQGEEIEDNVEDEIKEEVKPQPKKRGRPKKSTQVKQSKQEEEEFASDWLDEDMSD